MLHFATSVLATYVLQLTDDITSNFERICFELKSILESFVDIEKRVVGSIERVQQIQQQEINVVNTNIAHLQLKTEDLVKSSTTENKRVFEDMSKNKRYTMQ